MTELPVNPEISGDEYDPDGSEEDYELIVRMYQWMKKRIAVFNLSGRERTELEKIQSDMLRAYPRLLYILKRRGISE